MPPRAAQLRGPEVGRAGRLLHTRARLDLPALRPGARLQVTVALDDRPGHGGEDAARACR